MELGPLVLARIGEVFMAFPVVDVREVLDDIQITRVPLAPTHILGLLNVRGEVVSVVDTRTLLDLPKDQGDQHLPLHLLLSHGGETKSFLVDEVLEVIRPEARELVSVPPGLSAPLEAVALRVIQQAQRLTLVCSVMALMHQIVTREEPVPRNEEEVNDR